MALPNTERKALIEERGTIAARVEAIRKKADSENRSATPEELAEVDRMTPRFSEIGEKLRADDAERAKFDAFKLPEPEPARRSDREPIPEPDRREKSTVAEVERSTLFRAWARSQANLPLTRAQRESCKRTGFNPRSRWFELRLASVPNRRAMGAGSGSAGGYLVPEGFSGMVDVALEATNQLRQAGTVMRTATGNPMPYPTVDDTANDGEQIGENTEVAAADVPVGVKTFGAYKFSTKLIPVGNELLEDEGIGLEQLIAQTGGERLGRIQGTRFTTGNGTSQPEGVVTAASAGVTAASATVIDPDEVVRLYYSVDPAYRASPKFGFMMNDGIRLQLSLMKDGEGRPLFQASYRDGEPDRVMGKPVWANQHMQATVATATVTMLAGDFSKFVIRDAGSIRFRRLDERYAEKDQTGFIGFLRSDSKLLNTAAIKKLTQA